MDIDKKLAIDLEEFSPGKWRVPKKDSVWKILKTEITKYFFEQEEGLSSEFIEKYQKESAQDYWERRWAPYYDL